MRFENPANGYVEKVTAAPLWCLLFGCVYFAVKGVWTHAVAALALAIFTVGITWLVYPFFATQIMRTHYLRRGWIELPDRPQEPYVEGSVKPRSTVGRAVLIALAVLLVIAAASLVVAVKQDMTGSGTTAAVSSPPAVGHSPGARR
jgi:uncharacterized membrane protein